MKKLKLGPDDVYENEGPLDLSGLWAVVDLDRPSMKDEPWNGVTQPGLPQDTDEVVAF